MATWACGRIWGMSRVGVMAALLVAGVAVGAAISTEPAAGPTVSQRLEERTFPSVFQAWSGADNLKNEEKMTTQARHDLLFMGVEGFGLHWKDARLTTTELVPESIPKALAMRKAMLQKNPHMLLLAELRYHDTQNTTLAQDSGWWMRDAAGKMVPAKKSDNMSNFYLLDVSNADLQAHVAARAAALVRSGVLDGVMFDWWKDGQDRADLARAVRKAFDGDPQIAAGLGHEALILVNANDHTAPISGKEVNGFFMECTHSDTAAQWKKISDSLEWAEANLRQPHINCLEIQDHGSREELNLMRAATCMSLTESDGFCLFGDQNSAPTPDHLHNWYDFWNKSLGKAVAKGVARPDGAMSREYENGTAIYNPMGNRDVTVTFDRRHKSVANGKSGRTFTVAGCDGDLFVKVGENGNK